MKVTYICHSGFLVELEKKYLLFDYYRGEIPELKKEKPLYVFSSHRHPDHFISDVFLLAGRHSNVTYLLSHDIRIKPYLERENLQVNLQDMIHTMRAGQNYQFPVQDGFMEEVSGQEIQITTLKSTDAGVAFLIRTEGKVLYHAGDLNWWHWEEEEEQYNHNMEVKFKKEVGKLAGLDIDAAFLPVDFRQGAAAYLGFEYVMSIANIKHAFPMHTWGQYHIIDKLCSNTAVLRVEREGQLWKI